MEAVILAGGLGTRLRPLTSTLSKPLVPVANVPIVRRIVDRLPRDVTRVIVTASHKVDAIRVYFEAHDVGRDVVVREEPEPLGTAGALRNVRHDVTGTFLAMNGDVLSSLDHAALLSFHREKRGLASLALWKVRDPRHFGVVAMTGSRISRFVEKPESKDDAPSFLANAGVYAFEPDIFDHIPDGRAVSLERETFPALIAAGRGVYGHPFTGYWVDVGRPESYLKANETVLRAERHKIAIADGVVDHGADFEEWAVVAPGCELGADSEVSRSVLLERARVGANAAVRDTIVGPDARVEDDAVVVDCVLGAGAVVRKGVLVKNVNVEPGDVIGDSEGGPA